MPYLFFCWQIFALLALHFYASGSYQGVISSSIYYGVSQSSMSKAILEVSLGLNQPTVRNKWVYVLRDMEELNFISQR